MYQHVQYRIYVYDQNELLILLDCYLNTKYEFFSLLRFDITRVISLLDVNHSCIHLYSVNSLKQIPYCKNVNKRTCRCFYTKRVSDSDISGKNEENPKKASGIQKSEALQGFRKHYYVKIYY